MTEIPPTNIDEFLSKIRLLSYARELGVKLRIYVNSTMMNEIKSAIRDGIIVQKAESDIETYFGFPLILSDRIPNPPGYLILPEPKIKLAKFELDDNWILNVRPDNPLVNRDQKIATDNDQQNN